MSRYQEIKNIKSPEDEINFLVKHHPELKDHINDLERLISNLTEIILKYEHRLISYRQETGLQAAKENSRKLKSMEGKAAKVDPKIAEMIADKWQKAEKNMPDSNQGNQKQEAMRLVAGEIKSFWIDVLGHEKFIYSEGNRHQDFARPFADDLKAIIFKGQKTTGFDKALSEIADSRKIK